MSNVAGLSRESNPLRKISNLCAVPQGHDLLTDLQSIIEFISLRIAIVKQDFHDHQTNVGLASSRGALNDRKLLC